jgi:hypothetical protein
MRAPVRAGPLCWCQGWNGWFWTVALLLAACVPAVAIWLDRAPLWFSGLTCVVLMVSAAAAHDHPRQASDVLFAASLFLLLLTLFVRPEPLGQLQAGMVLLAAVGWGLRRRQSPDHPEHRP